MGRQGLNAPQGKEKACGCKDGCKFNQGIEGNKVLCLFKQATFDLVIQKGCPDYQPVAA
jgi:hypothetical protein